MWFSIGSKSICLGIWAFIPVFGALSPLWSIAYVNEPYYLKGAFHPTLEGSRNLDVGKGFRAHLRLSLATEAYGLFEPRRDPRAWDIAWGLLCGTGIPFLPRGLEVSAGIGAVLGRAQGELYFSHVWDRGLFPENSREYRKRIYADVGVPFQVQWVFGHDPEGFGLLYSGFLSRELQRWGIGVCWQYYFGPAPHSMTRRAPKPAATSAPEPDPEGSGPVPEVLEE